MGAMLSPIAQSSSLMNTNNTLKNPISTGKKIRFYKEMIHPINIFDFQKHWK